MQELALELLIYYTVEKNQARNIKVELPAKESNQKVFIPAKKSNQKILILAKESNKKILILAKKSKKQVVLPALNSNNLAFDIFSYFPQPNTQIKL